MKELISIIFFLIFNLTNAFCQDNGYTFYWDNGNMKYQDWEYVENFTDSNNVAYVLVLLQDKYFDKDENEVSEIVFIEMFGKTEFDSIHTKIEIEEKKKEDIPLFDSNYTDLIKKADNSFFNKQYEDALKFYQEAALIMPHEEYPIEQIEELKKL